MPKRFVAAITAAFISLLALGFYGAQSVRAADDYIPRTYTVQMTYVPSDNYTNRLVNSKASFDKLQKFFDQVQFKPKVNYSFLRDVLHGTLAGDDGFVQSAKGYGYGACGASSLLNTLVQTATFKDSDGKEKPVFLAVLVWTWNGDKTYGKYGATIYLDYTGKHKVKDYIWKVNPLYTGPSPRITSDFNMDTGTVSLTMDYADKAPAAAMITPGQTATAAPAVDTDDTLTSTMPLRFNGPMIGKESRAALLTDQLKAIIGTRRFGISIKPIGNAAQVIDEVGVNDKLQIPVASAFKGPVALYFFENIDPDIWNSLPIFYWNIKDPTQVPGQYKAAWLKNHDILHDLYWMSVYSENDATGNVLAYVWQNSTMGNEADNPITAFNDWAHSSVGMSMDSGLHLWLAGRSACAKCIDARYAGRHFIYGTKVIQPNNTFSPDDLSKFYVRLATVGQKMGYYAAATELLSIPEDNPSMIEQYTTQFGITEASKDGFVGPYSPLSDGYYESTDAGLITLPDETQYAVAFMSFDAGDLMADSITTSLKALINADATAASEASLSSQPVPAAK